MERKILRKMLTIGAILLFLCVAIEPITSTDITQNKTTPEMENIDPKDYLFETIIEIANDPEVAALLEEYEQSMSISGFPIKAAAIPTFF